jgi:hypothetical protein
MRIISLICLLLLFGCTEPYLLQTKDFEEALVIEATLTNELKTQEIKLSKTYKLEENGPEFVEDATIVIEDDLGNAYSFVEADEKYESTTAFQAVPGRKYKLTINVEGKTYVSTQELLTTVNPIQSIENKAINYLGVRGVEIKVKAFDPTNSSKYYRYEYEETYKIIAPKWIPQTITINPDFNPFGSKDLIINPRTYEARVCYSTKKSDDILVYNTTNLSEDRVDYMVRFIPVSNPIIMHRYSILVKQYVQNLAAHTYYNTLKKIAKNTGSILSQNQPGFFRGNITCQTNPNEKVIGFFDVSTVSSQRIFFNFEDVFPNTMKPGYFYDCFDNGEGRFDYCFGDIVNRNCTGEEVETILNGIPQQYLYFNGPDPENFIQLVPPPCGDCTTFSSNIIPPFWQ